MTDIKSLHIEQYGVISCVHLATPEQDTLEYLPCEAALGAGGIDIREVSDAGEVNGSTLATGFTLEYEQQLVHETVMVLEKTEG